MIVAKLLTARRFLKRHVHVLCAFHIVLLGISFARDHLDLPLVIQKVLWWGLLINFLICFYLLQLKDKDGKG